MSVEDLFFLRAKRLLTSQVLCCVELDETRNYPGSYVTIYISHFCSDVIIGCIVNFQLSETTYFLNLLRKLHYLCKRFSVVFDALLLFPVLYGVSYFAR
jgi:asparagine N-glycosylation enzyme membrane subunit Stt3